MAEVFPHFRPLFTVLLHSLPLPFLVPLLLRFPNHPLPTYALTYLSIALLKPYVALPDLSLSVVHVLLAARSWRLLSGALFLLGGVGMLVALQAGMWWQWIVVGSANSNFFYAATLGLGLV